MTTSQQNLASSGANVDVSRTRAFLQSLLLAGVISFPMLGILIFWVFSTRQEMLDARIQLALAEQAYERLIASPSESPISLEAAKHGREKFKATCAICHGPDGTGVDGLGRNLTTSDFVARSDDATLQKFVVTGRPNAKPTPMPPKGGYDDLTDAEIRDIVAWIRCLQDPRRAPELPAMTVAATPVAPSEADKAAALEAAGGNAELAGYIASGNKLFHTTCVACHGKGGVGIKGNGAALANSAFIQSLDEDGLLSFIQSGRAPSDPKNKTGIQMPPKGGNPALSEDDLLDIIAYLRTLQPVKETAAK